MTSVCQAFVETRLSRIDKNAPNESMMAFFSVTKAFGSHWNLLIPVCRTHGNLELYTSQKLGLKLKSATSYST